ncbi:hypothetical protein SARC_00327 [Sphaeroforma arctica JP610]|uniref:Uncharacterized protein n=1 Tax=Sphaeroforma arctica JP610 TaxID=667725 RepID=A0A0L0GF14_9EUKA|nr:hypothetical protein SARC_00327 [Sphaeroforma arctica JP610]KNC87562.1 hypothetical protein SARC_00327 [Sphaeroforma arctica JP610]|eukprot:XP_014161464.1 hypothetical protein SARC_00327 [Sphaeroforma arctica JP610]
MPTRTDDFPTRTQPDTSSFKASLNVAIQEYNSEYHPDQGYTANDAVPSFQEVPLGTGDWIRQHQELAVQHSLNAHTSPYPDLSDNDIATQGPDKDLSAN